MKHDDMDSILRQTLDDRRLSRSEKRALTEVFADEVLSAGDLAWLRSRAFDLVREEFRGHENQLVLGWLEDVVKVIAASAPASVEERTAEAWFTPGTDAPSRIVSTIRSTRRTLDVCVFTITDDRLTRALLEAKGRGVALRVITDDDKSFDRGSDIKRLENAGVPVRMDRSASHMHHKFALFDGSKLLTGSYNWTRSAADNNQENFVVVDDPRLISAYSRTFESLWKTFGN